MKTAAETIKTLIKYGIAQDITHENTPAYRHVMELGIARNHRGELAGGLFRDLNTGELLAIVGNCQALYKYI